MVTPGRWVLNALTAWLTKAVRSARNSTRLTQLAFMSWSTKAMTVRVLPEPVAMTSRAARWRWSSSAPISLMARTW